MGMFNAVTGMGYALGPLSLTVVGTDGWPPLLVGMGGFVGCAVLMFLTTAGLKGFEDDGERTGGVWRFWALAPALLVAVIVSAATQQSVYSLLPVFGKSYGLPEVHLAAMVTVLSVGNIVLQIPLGLLAERFGGRTMIVACALANMTGAILLPFVVATPLIWPVLIMIGGVGYGVYTMAMVELGSRFSGSTLVAGNAAFALMWGLGGVIGPPGSGFAMQQIGAPGLPAVIATLSAFLVAFSLYRSMTRRQQA
jgi:MFS family permease